MTARRDSTVHVLVGHLSHSIGLLLTSPNSTASSPFLHFTCVPPFFTCSVCSSIYTCIFTYLVCHSINCSRSDYRFQSRFITQLVGTYWVTPATWESFIWIQTTEVHQGKWALVHSQEKINFKWIDRRKMAKT